MEAHIDGSSASLRRYLTPLSAWAMSFGCAVGWGAFVMPGKTGIEACSEFRASMHPKARTLPIIGISADTNLALFDKAISAGMNSMTLKPLTLETLRRILP